MPNSEHRRFVFIILFSRLLVNQMKQENLAVQIFQKVENFLFII